MPRVLPRAVESALNAALKASPVVVVTGARQTGKSTLVQSAEALAGRTYLTLDDIDVRDQARRAPSALLARADALVIDEVQRAPDLLLALKAAVDRDRPRRPGRFVLTGSTNLLLMSRVSESLAGRAYYLKLWPLTRRERLGRGRVGLWSELIATASKRWPDLIAAEKGVKADWREESEIGGLPVPAYELKSRDARARWFDGYVETYLERDLQVLASIDNLADFRRLLRVAALRVGTILNQADFARDVAISRPTAHRWINLLETSFQIVLLSAFATNRTKRLVKSPKIYATDVALARHLSGGEPTGAHLENLVLADLNAWRELVSPRPDISYWRTPNQEEVDFVVESRQRVLPIEVKATSKPTFHDVRHLVTFMAQHKDRVDGGLLLHGGDGIFTLAEGIVAVPWYRVI